MRDALYTPLWWLAGLTIDAMHATGRALHLAADWLAGRTGARLTFEEEGREDLLALYDRMVENAKAQALRELANESGVR